MILTIIVLIIILFVLIRDLVTSDVAFFGALIVLLLGGLITADEALSGFSNPGVATVGLLFIISYAVEKTGVLVKISDTIFLKNVNANGTKRAMSLLLFFVMMPVTLLSAFLNNTPVVTIFVPAVKNWCKEQQLAASKFMIPISYAAIFGGMTTLIGTSTNLLVHGLMIQNGLPGFSFFELTKVALPVALVGYVYLITIGYRLLPKNIDMLSHVEQNPKEYYIEMIVPGESSYIGKTIQQANLRSLPDVYLSDIERGDLHLGPVTPDRRIELGDRLFFSGKTDGVSALLHNVNLSPATPLDFQQDSLKMNKNLIEVVISHECPGVGLTIKAFGFRGYYNAGVIGISRGGNRINTRLGDVVIRPGDSMVILADKRFIQKYKYSRDFYMVTKKAEIEPSTSGKNYFIIGVLAVMLLIAIFGSNFQTFGRFTIDTLYAVSTAVALIIISKIISIKEAKSSIRWDVLITIGAAFGISKALENSGLAFLISNFFVSSMSIFGTLGVVFAIYAMTSLFTEVISNNAAAALMFPIALSSVQQLGNDSLPFFVAVAIGASASFATPIGYQTNLIVQAAGGYKFTDFLKVGIPLNLLSMLVSIGAIHFWYLR